MSTIPRAARPVWSVSSTFPGSSMRTDWIEGKHWIFCDWVFLSALTSVGQLFTFAALDEVQRRFRRLRQTEPI